MNTTAFLIIMGLLKVQGPVEIWGNMKGKTLKIIIDGYKLGQSPPSSRSLSSLSNGA